MIRTKTTRIYLLTPEVWQEPTNRALKGLSRPSRAYAEAVLRLAHSRHVGAPAELIAPLIPLILTPLAHCSNDNPWKSILARLKKELSNNRPVNGSEHGLILNSNPAWCVLKLVLPLISYASRELGMCYLYCEEGVNTGVEPVHYQAYVKNLTKVLRELPERSDAALDIFWKDRALTLASLSATSTRESHTGELPEAQGTALGLVLRVSTKPEEEARQQRSLRKLISRTKHKTISRTREGGNDGIHLTRRPEDLDGILLSEFINPEFLLTDRLLNTGFFALQRAPSRQRLNDVHIAAILPGAFANSLIGDYLKACWFDCMARLGHRLRTCGLSASTFSWMEGDQQGRLYKSAFELTKLPSFAQVDDGQMSEAWRGEFLTSLGWVPHFFIPKEGQMVQSPEQVRESPGELALTWCTSAWKHLSAQQRDDTNKKAYTLLHLMVFLPGNSTDEPFPSLTQTAANMAMGNHQGKHISITRVPLNFQQRDIWAYSAVGRQPRSLVTESEQEADEKKVASALVNAWLDQFTKEIWRV